MKDTVGFRVQKLEVLSAVFISALLVVSLLVESVVEQVPADLRNLALRFDQSDLFRKVKRRNCSDIGVIVADRVLVLLPIFSLNVTKHLFNQICVVRSIVEVVSIK